MTSQPRWCDRCQCRTPWVRTRSSVFVHLLFTLISFGAWIFVWLRDWTAGTGFCSRCGRCEYECL